MFLCIVAGIALGQIMPTVFHSVGRMEVAHVNLPVAILIWLMIIPMLLKIDLKEIKGVRRHWRGVAVTLFVNWGVKPFSMALLAWLFIGHLFRPHLPAEQIDSYIAGLIILAAAPCTAMVFVWSQLTRGEPHFTLSQVALKEFESFRARRQAERAAEGRRLRNVPRLMSFDEIDSDHNGLINEVEMLDAVQRHRHGRPAPAL